MKNTKTLGTYLTESFREFINVFPFYGKGKISKFLAKMFLPKSKSLVSLRTGSKMVLDFQNELEVLMYFDIFAKPLSKLMEHVLATGDVFVDCGANVGYMSFFAAPLVTNKGKVVAIEANPYCVERIIESKEMGGGGNIEIIGRAVGQRTGKMNFNITDDPMYSTFSDADRLAWTSIKKSIDVEVETLDKMMANILSESEKIRLLKLDVEGAELLAMLGAENLLRDGRIDYVYVEIHPAQLKLMGGEVDDFHSLMKKHNYRPTIIKDSRIYIYSSPDSDLSF